MIKIPTFLLLGFLLPVPAAVAGNFAGSSSLLAEPDLEQAIEQDAQQFQNRAMSLGQSLSQKSAYKSIRCKQMNQQVQVLNGKPQLMYIAQKRFEAECLAGY